MTFVVGNNITRYMPWKYYISSSKEDRYTLIHLIYDNEVKKMMMKMINVIYF